MKRRMVVLTGARLSGSALQAVALIALARSTAVPQFGEFSVVFAVQSTIFTIGALGLQGYVLREMARQRGARVRGALRLNMASSAVAAIVALVATLGVRRDAGGLLIAAALVCAFTLEKNAGVRQAVLISKGGILRPSMSTAVVPLVTMLSVVSLPVGDRPLAYAIGRLGGASIGLALVTGASKVFGRDGSADSLGTTLRRVWPLAVNGIVTTAVTFDTAVVGGLSGRVQAAFYSAATKLIAPLAIGTSSVSTVLMPHAAVLDLEGARRLRRSIMKLGLALLAASVPGSLLAPVAVQLLFGSAYAGAGSVLMVMIWAVPSLTVGPLLETYLQATNRERAVAAIAVVYSAAAVSGAVVGTLALGALGVAISVTVLNTLKVIVQLAMRPAPEPPSPERPAVGATPSISSQHEVAQPTKAGSRSASARQVAAGTP